MPIDTPTLIASGFLFLLIFLSGYWLNRVGKPYGSFPFNIHKLIGLAMGVFLAVMVFQRSQEAHLDERAVSAIAVTLIIFILTVVAGGLLGAQDSGTRHAPSQPILMTLTLVHKVFPYLAVLSTAVTLWLLK